jgi:hypothetical protein
VDVFADGVITAARIEDIIEVRSLSSNERRGFPGHPAGHV